MPPPDRHDLAQRLNDVATLIDEVPEHRLVQVGLIVGRIERVAGMDGPPPPAPAPANEHRNKS